MKRIAISQTAICGNHGRNIDALEQNYVQYYEDLSMRLFPIPNLPSRTNRWLSDIKPEGIILSGGNNINPKLYREVSETGGMYADCRDQTELRIIDYAITHRIPLIGECRGLHMINVYFGGKLTQKITNGRHLGVEHVAEAHEVSITDSKVTTYLGGNLFIVNSYHNQGISSGGLAKSLRAFAFAGDEIIEAVYHPKLPIAGIQWHPEREIDKREALLNEKIIKAFLNEEIFWRK